MLMIYMRFTDINYYKLAVEKDRDSIFTTITTIYMETMLKIRFFIFQPLAVIFWFIIAAIALSVTFGPFTAFHEDARPWTISEKILYNTTRHLAWGIVLAWVTYACEYGYGGECGPVRCSRLPSINFEVLLVLKIG